MPWFGNHTHMDVGYSSEDPAVLRKQIQQARHMGISAFVVDWYARSNPYSDHNFALVQAAASESHFQVALLYNEAEDENAQETDAEIASLDEAYKNTSDPTPSIAIPTSPTMAIRSFSFFPRAATSIGIAFANTAAVGRVRLF